MTDIEVSSQAAPELKRKAGRPRKSPDGRRVVLHINLSPGATEALKSLCDRPVQAVSRSAMIEHLILEASKPHLQGKPLIEVLGNVPHA